MYDTSPPYWIGLKTKLELVVVKPFQ